MSRHNWLKQLFLLFVITSLLIPSINNKLIKSTPMVSGLEDRKISVEYTENELICDMRWGSFLEDCGGGTYLNLYGSPKDITLNMDMNFDRLSLNGTLGGSYTYDSGVIKEYMAFNGEFEGGLGVYNWNYNSWFWRFGSNFTLSLTFRMEHLCTDSQGNQYWDLREENIQVPAQLIGDSFAGRGGIGLLSITWEDPGTGTENSRYFNLRCRNYLSSGGCDLPAELPDVVDIQCEVTGPETVHVFDNSIVFNLIFEGRDQDMVAEVNWYFWYYDEIWGEYSWHETFEKKDLSSLTISAKKLKEWAILARDYGESVESSKVLPMQILVEMKTDQDKWLFDTKLFNFTYILNEPSGFEMQLVDSLTIYPTAVNQTIIKLSYSNQLSDKITFDIIETLPDYLKIDMQKTTADKSPTGILENKITVSLDTGKTSSLSLPVDIPITIRAKSKIGTENVEALKQVTMKIRPAKWLIMHYCASNTPCSLQSEDVKNIQEIIEALEENNTTKVGYTLFIDLATAWSPPEYGGDTKLSGYQTHFMKYFNGKIELIGSSSATLMSSASTLVNFIEKAEKTIPADNKILIITDHGQGQKGIITGYDEKIMSITELKGALVNHRPDLLILEACYMGQLQVLYEIRDVADYIIASQTTMNGRDFKYTDALRPLLKDSSRTALQVGKDFIDNYELRLKLEAVSLIDTSKIESVVESQNKLMKTIEREGSEKGEEYKKTILEVKKGSNDLGDVRCFAENIIKTESLQNTQTKIDAELLKNAVDSAVVSYRMQVNNTLLIYSDGSRNLIPIDDLPDIPQTLGDSIRKDSVRQLFGIGDGHSWGEGLEYYSKYSWPSTISQSQSDRIEIKKTQNGNNLYIRIEDSQGYINGFNHGALSKSRIQLDYLDAEYFDYYNGTEVLVFPSVITEFMAKVYGGYMEEQDESYSVTFTLYQNDEKIVEKIIDNPIHEYTEQTFTVTITDGEIEVGDILSTELEITNTDLQPENETSPESTGIQGYSLEAIILGVILYYSISRKRFTKIRIQKNGNKIINYS